MVFNLFQKIKLFYLSITSSEDDELILERMGYKQDLIRGLGPYMNFAFGFTEVGVVSSISALFGYGLSTGGPATIIWGWLVTFAMTMIVGYSMAEICSTYPAAGSVYHWSGMIVPEKWAPLASFVCGWFNFLGNAAGDASFASAFASFLAACISLSGGETLSTGDVVGISIGILGVWTILNSIRITEVGWINVLASFIQFSTVIFILVGLTARTSQLSTGHFVFTTYYNGTGWSQKSYVCSIGLLSSLFAFSGYEASAHMAEETTSARTAAPYGIVFTCFATGIVGLIFLLGLLFVITDVDVALNGPTLQPVVDTFVAAGGEKYGKFLSWLIVINLFFAGLSSVSVTGRITFALCRDKALPYADFWAKVHDTSKEPLRILVLLFLVDSLLLLLPLASTVAFASITGITTIGFQVSYGIPILLKLIFSYNDFPGSEVTLGRLSNPMGVISCLWLFGTSCLLFLPSSNPVTNETMNWTVVVIGGFGFIAAVYWIFYAQYNFRGPVRTKHDLLKKTELTAVALVDSDKVAVVANL